MTPGDVHPGPESLRGRPSRKAEPDPPSCPASQYGNRLALWVSTRRVEVHVNTEKLAPTKVHHFIADQLNGLAVRGKVVSVWVDDSAYLVMLSLADDRGITFRQLSPYDVSRSLRGNPDALAVLRADLLRDVSIGASGRFIAHSRATARWS